jgi:hypothetical protein
MGVYIVSDVKRAIGTLYKALQGRAKSHTPYQQILDMHAPRCVNLGLETLVLFGHGALPTRANQQASLTATHLQHPRSSMMTTKERTYTSP